MFSKACSSRDLKLGDKPQDESAEVVLECGEATSEDDSGQMLDPCAAVRMGNFVIGAVDHVNGEGAARRSVAISRYEGKLLVRHWLEASEDIQRWWRLSGQVGSGEMREKAYAQLRVRELEASGLVTTAEVHQIDEEIWTAHRPDWQMIEQLEEQGLDPLCAAPTSEMPVTETEKPRTAHPGRSPR